MQEIFTIVILIMSVVIHEMSHGYTALAFGDQTAKYAGRLTLNPLKHLDPIGSVIVPLILVLLPGGFVFGWAKPVPYNPNNLRNLKWGTISVASAGVLANLFLALIFGLLIRIVLSSSWAVPQSFLIITGMIVFINVLLAIFNLIPVSPLDGSKIFFSLLPDNYRYIAKFLEQYSIFVILFIIFFLWGYIQPIMFWLFKVFSGMSAFEFFNLLQII
ncbi:hypothetical protein A2995_00130 [Candidatus Nomurabacteria bacterium RIFCSPLOWO2_01_FULL_33_24]|uniref:Peptidase M50 domain-containing protein n=1 Tax=Candidatus Nomurabacteria bacterium RIFCSPLOWO2_01_FULL_33_24 TaxID=1801765 RepID=A0A1F6X1Z4_9BACT|nr:MAG: hypothetical protein A2995_00130 [Candidatus Nomurabacteria bacterium RIFCSPLOWO2_01_FULL_33_24]